MPVKKEISKKSTAKRLPSTAKKAEVGSRKSDSLSIPVYSLAGRSVGTLSLPKEIFGQEVNKRLLAQALRVYMTNQKTLSAFTKTRGEVQGSTAKIYRQKGTGRARHGSVRAPIFVGGGITFGPKPRKVRLNLPQSMKKAALISALSSKMADKNIIGLTGIEKASGKTKEMAKLAKNLKLKTALIVIDEKMDNMVRAVRNIQDIHVLPANLINAYEVLRHDMLILTKDAVEKLKKVESRVESQESGEEGIKIKSQKSKVKNTIKNSKVSKVRKEKTSL